jgi:hypothetical protein
LGTKPEKSVIPYCAKVCFMPSETSIGFGFDIYLAAINPPKIIPATKNKFQISFFHSY